MAKGMFRPSKTFTGVPIRSRVSIDALGGKNRLVAYRLHAKSQFRDTIANTILIYQWSNHYFFWPSLNEFECFLCTGVTSAATLDLNHPHLPYKGFIKLGRKCHERHSIMNVCGGCVLLLFAIFLMNTAPSLPRLKSSCSVNCHVKWADSFQDVKNARQTRTGKQSCLQWLQVWFSWHLKKVTNKPYHMYLSCQTFHLQRWRFLPLIK